MEISGTTSFFLKQPCLFYQPLCFYVKNMNPLPHLFFESFKKGWGPVMLYLFQVKKVTFTDWKITAMLSLCRKQIILAT